MILENIKVDLKKIYRKGAVGGTFDIFHKGHERLLTFAAKMCYFLIVGVTSDSFVKLYKNREVDKFEIRVKNLRNFLKNFQDETKIEIIEINDKYGPSVEMPDLEAIFVTLDTVETAFEINEIRMRNHLKPLEIVIVPKLLAEDGNFISSSRIRAGEIDREGKKLK